MRVALATCAEIPELEPDDRLLLPALADRGIEGVPAVWDDAAVAWEAFDLVVLRSTWDYAERRDEFLAWARSLPRVLNDVPLLEWNTDKRYLEDLPAAVETAFVPPGAPFEPPPEPFVVKPSVSAGGRSSARFGPDEPVAAHELVARIHADGRTAMIQRFIEGEEKALVYIGGAYSHALKRRVPLPAGGDRTVLYLDEELSQAEATAQGAPDSRGCAGVCPRPAAVCARRSAGRLRARARADGAVSLLRVRSRQRRAARGGHRRAHCLTGTKCWSFPVPPGHRRPALHAKQLVEATHGGASLQRRSPGTLAA